MVWNIKSPECSSKAWWWLLRSVIEHTCLKKPVLGLMWMVSLKCLDTRRVSLAFLAIVQMLSYIVYNTWDVCVIEYLVQAEAQQMLNARSNEWKYDLMKGNPSWICSQLINAIKSKRVAELKPATLCRLGIQQRKSNISQHQEKKRDISIDPHN